MSGNYQASQIPPAATDGRRQHYSDPVQYNYEPQGQRDDLSLRMLMPYLDELAANGLTIAGNLDMSTEWESIRLTHGRPRDHLQQLLDQWLQGEERQGIPHTLTFFLGIVRQCGKGKLAQKMEREIQCSNQSPQHLRSVPTYRHQQPQPQHYPQQGAAIQSQHQGQQYPMRNEAYGQFQPHNDCLTSAEIPSRVQQSRMAYSSHQQGQGYQAGYGTPPPSHGRHGRRTSEPPQFREMSTGQPQQYWTDHQHQSLTYPQRRSLADPQQRWMDPQLGSLADPLQRNSTDHQHQAPSLLHEQTHVARPPPPVDSSSHSSSRKLWTSDTSGEQTFEGSGNMFNEGSGPFFDVDEETLTEPVEENSGSQPTSVDLKYTSAVHDGPREGPFSNLPSQPSRVSQQEYNLQPYAGYDSHSGPASQSNLRAPSGDLMQPTVMQPRHSTLHGGASRNPPVPNSTLQGQFVPQQQQSGNPQSADTAQHFRLLPSGLSRTANEPLTKEQLARIFLQAKRQLQQNSLEADFGQNEGQRCIPVHKLVNFYRGVFRIEINYRERNSVCRGSGFFVKVEKQHWILTACHNLLSADDGGLMREGKWTDIMVLVEGKWCKIKTLDQALQVEALKVKMQENLLQAEFLLPDNDFVLTERQSLDQVIPNVGHLAFDPKDDILAIPCVDPERLELECGAKVTAFHLDLDVMQHYTPHFADLLAIVHCPWDMPTPDGWRGTPPRDIVHYNHGTLCNIDGTAIRYDMVTYKGSSGSPVFFCGLNGIKLVGVHRRSHIDPFNQCSHLTAEFITNKMLP